MWAAGSVVPALVLDRRPLPDRRDRDVACGDDPGGGRRRLAQHRYGNVALAAGNRDRPDVSVAGVAGGTALAESLPEDVLRTLFAVLLLVTAARLVWSIRPGSAREVGTGRRPQT